MTSTNRKRWAVACMSGSFKAAFVQGVLNELEAGGFRADAYASTSSPSLAAAFAAAGRVREIDLDIWHDNQGILEQPGTSLSDAVLAGIRAWAPWLREFLFRPETARFSVAVSHVRTAEAALITQGDGARRLGRRLVVDAARHDTTWRDKHLDLQMFDTKSSDPALRITPRNLEEVLYATTRMLHAWHIPAFIGTEPYVDGSYTCQCPAIEMAQQGFDGVIAIATEPAPIARDFFGTSLIPGGWNEVPIVLVAPHRDLKEIGVDFRQATKEGLEQAFAEGVAAARTLLSRLSNLTSSSL